MNDKDTSNKNMTYIFNGIKPELEKLGYIVELTNQTRWKEKSDTDRIKITLDGSEIFLIEILGKEWNYNGRASVHFNTDKTVNREDNPSPYGDRNTISDRYGFDHYIDYDSPLKNALKSLHIEFKADKSIKLILNDILPAIATYTEIVRVVTPKIEAAIAQNMEVLALQNYVQKFTEYPHREYRRFGNRHFTTSIGDIKISDYGTIEVTRRVTAEELKELLSKAPPLKENEE